MKKTKLKKQLDFIPTIELGIKDREMIKEKICVSFFHKGKRRVVRINPKQPKSRQKFLLIREYNNMVRDINLS